jgi:hypothetical protein
MCYDRRVDPDALRDLIDLAFDFAAAQRISAFVELEDVLEAIDQASAPERLARGIARFVAPSRQRLLAGFAASERRLESWLPPVVKDGLAAFLGQPVRVPPEVIDEAVRSQKTREAVRAMLSEAVTSMVERAFKVPGGRGVKSVVGLAGAAGRGLFGGLGAEVQRQFQERLRDFVDFGVQLVLDRIAERLRSEETARSLGKRRRRGFLDLMGQTEAWAARHAQAVPFSLLDAMTPAIVTHNLLRAEVRALLRDEIAAALAELDTQTVGELLEELGLKALVRDKLHARLGPLAAAFVATPEVAAWQARLAK